MPNALRQGQRGTKVGQSSADIPKLPPLLKHLCFKLQLSSRLQNGGSGVEPPWMKHLPLLQDLQMLWLDVWHLPCDS